MKDAEKVAAILTLMISSIPVVYELSKEENTSIAGIAFFGIILLSIALYFVYLFIWSQVKNYLSTIEQNTRRINHLEKTLKYQHDFHQLDKRVSIIESHEKRSNKS